MLYFDESTQQSIIAEMVQDPKITWWHDDDRELWIARHSPSGAAQVHTNRDDALVRLYVLLRSGEWLQRVAQGLMRTGALSAI